MCICNFICYIKAVSRIIIAHLFTFSFSSRYGSESSPFTTTIDYTGDIVYLEHVVVTMTVETSGRRGTIQILLTSPSGTESILLGRRTLDYGSDYYSWPFMSVMFWGENPAGEWTLTVSSLANIEARVTVAAFQFYGTSTFPQAVANIPVQCHSDCARGCAAKGSAYCDACVNLRNAYTLKCIESCPIGFTKRNGYCYNAAKPERTCNVSRENKGEILSVREALFIDFLWEIS